MTGSGRSPPTKSIGPAPCVGLSGATGEIGVKPGLKRTMADSIVPPTGSVGGGGGGGVGVFWLKNDATRCSAPPVDSSDARSVTTSVLLESSQKLSRPAPPVRRSLALPPIVTSTSSPAPPLSLLVPCPP